MFFCTLDDIIKKSVWLAKTAKVIDPHLGWYNPQVYFPPPPPHPLSNPHFFCAVQDVYFEQIKPTFDSLELDDSKELRFNVAPSSDYFTRFFCKKK